MKKTLVYLSEEEYEALRRAAFEEHKKMSQILREGLSEYLKRRGTKPKRKEKG